MSTYTATVTREGSAWLAQCVQEPTAHTWAPTLAALRREIVDAVILAADLPDDADVTVRLVAGEGLSQDLAEVLAE
ncbi:MULTISPECIES: hypothetical protein [unclassified Actinomyces]|uniref:hypothetical protein n=1 Tax=unclassified Actinomyces TaxID=2609248 RepID=UPI00201774D2|nr:MULTISPECIES: hypothetical protein [unclassified Actinomyces]MCL3776793.1 hypothetical protein [Actinomyces sp. AC-20-1]MCL3789887.1 hypothetical protein [Actinomyces sp. 187325]MCL3792224.1 hypothetical protein [Actinomyces sp. 186855]MCL3794786.1 hypothetical protein [Actinomyces sp. 217892]